MGKGQTLGDSASDTQTGKRAGTGRESDPVQIGKAKPGLAKRRADQWQQRFRMRHTDRTETPQHDAIAPEGNGAKIGRGLDGQQIHGRILPVLPAAVAIGCQDTPCRLAGWRRPRIFLPRQPDSTPNSAADMAGQRLSRYNERAFKRRAESTSTS